MPAALSNFESIWCAGHTAARSEHCRSARSNKAAQLTKARFYSGSRGA